MYAAKRPLIIFALRPFILLALVLFSGARAKATWTLTTIDGLPAEGQSSLTNNAGLHCSLALDLFGNPGISYYSNPHSITSSLRFAKVQNGQVTIQDVAVFQGTRNPFNSLEFDSLGMPRIAFANGSALDYASSRQGTWTTERVAFLHGSLASGWTPISLAIDGSDIPHIGYFDSDAGLSYATKPHASWMTTRVDKEGNKSTGYEQSLRLRADGLPSIAYAVNAEGLRYAAFEGGTWNIETVDPGFMNNSYPSLAFDRNDRPAITYGRSAGGGLVIAERGVSDWSVSQFVSGAYDNSLQFDTQGYPHVAYHEEGLMYARWNGSSWTRELIDAEYNGYQPGYHPSLALNDQGYAFISYYELINGDLKLATNIPEPSAVLCLMVCAALRATFRRYRSASATYGAA